MYPSALQLSPFSHTLVWCVVRTHKRNGFAFVFEIEDEKPVLSVAEYRELMNDRTSSDERIRERIDCLVRLARKNAQTEIKKYVGTRK